MEKLLNAISGTSWAATIILFSYWMIDFLIPDELNSPSGWWWFGCALVAVFTSELND